MPYGMRPSGAIRAPKFWSWDAADAEAVAHDICSVCLKITGTRLAATHLLHAECGCGHHETKFCATHTREYANVLESSCGECGQPRVFSEPIRVGVAREDPQPPRTSDPPAPFGPDTSYLGEEADEWLA